MRELECRYDGPIPARLLDAALTSGRRHEYARCRADAAIAMLDRHLASHHAMTGQDHRLYLDWLRQWHAHRDALVHVPDTISGQAESPSP